MLKDARKSFHPQEGIAWGGRQEGGEREGAEGCISLPVAQEYLLLTKTRFHFVSLPSLTGLIASPPPPPSLLSCLCLVP